MAQKTSGRGSSVSAKEKTREKKSGELFKSTVSDRYRDILDAAATLFAERGYIATSVRDIGERVGLLGGSLYHHIKSKEALYTEIHDIALQSAADHILEAVSKHTDPWARFEAACVKMLELELDPHSITMPLMNDFRSVPPEVQRRLVPKRDEFEQVFVGLIKDLPLDPRIDRSIYRILLLTLLNNVNIWYREGPLTPADIGRQIVMIFRHDAPA